MEDSITKTRNITYDRIVLFSSKQQKGELVESFYGRLTEQAENCSLGDEETTSIRYTFIFNIIDYETQKKFLKRQCRQLKLLKLQSILRWGSKPTKDQPKPEHQCSFSNY